MTDPKTNIAQKFVPYPPSYLKSKLKQYLQASWQNEWNLGLTGRFTYALKPRVSEDYLLRHKYLYIFAINHGPFPAYLYKINKTESPCCTCGERGDSLHYVLKCPLTATLHLRKTNSVSLSNWFKLITGNSTENHRMYVLIRKYPVSFSNASYRPFV